jgi:hypothetical protein
MERMREREKERSERGMIVVRYQAKVMPKPSMLETGDAILSAKDKPDFGRPGPFNFFLL